MCVCLCVSVEFLSLTLQSGAGRVEIALESGAGRVEIAWRGLPAAAAAAAATVRRH